MREAVERFWSKVDRSAGSDSCWPWLAGLNNMGYGKFSIGSGSRRMVYTHRYAYELTVGTIPPGFTLDHLCHTNDPTCAGGVTCPHRRCVNPAHLEPVTNRENQLRGNGVGGRNARKTHCARGHEYTPENTYMRPDGGGRQCRTCASLREVKRAICLICGKEMANNNLARHRRSHDPR